MKQIFRALSSTPGTRYHSHTIRTKIEQELENNKNYERIPDSMSYNVFHYLPAGVTVALDGEIVSLFGERIRIGRAVKVLRRISKKIDLRLEEIN
ncbi:hypothetical protein J4423_00835 [Candidatus Pacearchaeota archaeon]|nr:hypothetical protein [Candidatus Pacearchaeota archaeon]